MSNLLAFGVMGFLSVSIIGVLIIVARIVYKDAKMHGMNATGWAWAAVLIPNLMGVIIYLIVKQNADKVYKCSACGERVKKDYNICPHCKSTLEDMCSECNHAVSSEMAYCPYCGAQVEKNHLQKGAVKEVQKTHIIKQLIGVGIGYIVIFVIALITMAVGTGAIQPSFALLNIETSTSNQLKSKFQYRIGRDSMPLTIGEDGHAVVDVQIELEKGQIELIVEDAEGEVAHTKVYQSGLYEEQLQVQGDAGDRYKVRLLIDGASGSYQVSKNQ